MNHQPTDVQVVAHLERLVKSDRLPVPPNGTFSTTLLQRVLARRGVAVGKHRLSGLIDDLGVRRRRNRSIDVACFKEMALTGVFAEFMRQHDANQARISSFGRLKTSG